MNDIKLVLEKLLKSRESYKIERQNLEILIEKMKKISSGQSDIGELKSMFEKLGLTDSKEYEFLTRVSLENIPREYLLDSYDKVVHFVVQKYREKFEDNNNLELKELQDKITTINLIESDGVDKHEALFRSLLIKSDDIDLDTKERIFSLLAVKSAKEEMLLNEEEKTLEQNEESVKEKKKNINDEVSILEKELLIAKNSAKDILDKYEYLSDFSVEDADSYHELASKMNFDPQTVNILVSSYNRARRDIKNKYQIIEYHYSSLCMNEDRIKTYFKSNNRRKIDDVLNNISEINENIIKLKESLKVLHHVNINPEDIVEEVREEKVEKKVEEKEEPVEEKVTQKKLGIIEEKRESNEKEKSRELLAKEFEYLKEKADKVIKWASNSYNYNQNYAYGILGTVQGIKEYLNAYTADTIDEKSIEELSESISYIEDYMEPEKDDVSSTELGDANLLLLLKDKNDNFCLSEDLKDLKDDDIRKNTKSDIISAMSRITSKDFSHFKELHIVLNNEGAKTTYIRDLSPRRIRQRDIRLSLVRLGICDENRRKLYEAGYDNFNDIFLIGGVEIKHGGKLNRLAYQFYNNKNYIELLNNLLSNPEADVSAIMELLENSEECIKEISRNGRDL